MALSRIKTWSAGEILTASDLNAELNNILTNALTLISPLTGNLDLDGNEFILDSDADSSITADTDDQIDFKLGGTDIFTLNTVASAVNGIAFTGSATTNAVDIAAFGTDTDVGIDITAKGAGPIILTTTDEVYSATVSANLGVSSLSMTGSSAMFTKAINPDCISSSTFL